MQLVVALRDTGRAQDFFASDIDVIQAPAWPMLQAAGEAAQRPATSASMGDMLANAGLAHPSELEAVVGAWRSLFRAYQVNLVLAEFAPGAALAARGVMPLAMTGNGYCQPPSDMAEFPLLHSHAPPRYVASEVEATVNQELLKFGGKPIGRLPQLFEADASFVSTLAILDPYRAVRKRRADGPLPPVLPDPATGQGSGVFAYLSPGVAVPDHLVETLSQLGPELAVYAPALSDGQKAALASAGCDCLQRPLDIARDLKSFALAMHYGVGGTSSMALLAGVPQLALSLDIEKDLNGRALQDAGCGKLIMLHRAGTKVEARLIREMAGDAHLGAHAREVARQLRPSVRPEMFERFIEDCVALARAA